MQVRARFAFLLSIGFVFSVQMSWAEVEGPQLIRVFFPKNRDSEPFRSHLSQLYERKIVNLEFVRSEKFLSRLNEILSIETLEELPRFDDSSVRLIRIIGPKEKTNYFQGHVNLRLDILINSHGRYLFRKVSKANWKNNQSENGRSVSGFIHEAKFNMIMDLLKFGPTFYGMKMKADGSLDLVSELIIGDSMTEVVIPSLDREALLNLSQTLRVMGAILSEINILPAIDLQFRVALNGRPYIVDTEYMGAVQSVDYNVFDELADDVDNEVPNKRRECQVTFID